MRRPVDGVQPPDVVDYEVDVLFAKGGEREVRSNILRDLLDRAGRRRQTHQSGAAWRPKINESIALPPVEMTRSADVGALLLLGSVAAHEPQLEAAGRIGLVNDFLSVMREEGIDVERRTPRQLRELAAGDIDLTDVEITTARREEDQLTTIRRPVRMKVTSRTARDLARGALAQRVDPDVHVAGAIGIECDDLTIRRPFATAILARRRNDRLGWAGGGPFRRQRQPPEIGILAQRRVCKLAARRNCDLNILSGALCQLLR